MSEHDLQPRTLYVRGNSEPRLSVVDEQHIADDARLARADSVQQQLLAAVSRIESDLKFIEQHIGQVAPGQHRGDLRMARRGVTNLTRKMRRP